MSYDDFLAGLAKQVEAQVMAAFEEGLNAGHDIGYEKGRTDEAAAWLEAGQ